MKDQLKGPANNNNDQIVAANYKNVEGPSGNKNTGSTAHNENDNIVSNPNANHQPNQRSQSSALLDNLENAGQPSAGVGGSSND